MFDFRLRVFYSVAKRLNFTKAATELCITQPAVSKHIHEIESHFKVQLFDRNGSRIRLTEAGEVLLGHCVKIFEMYDRLEFDLNSFANSFGGRLRIGASTTIAQYLLPPLLADFHQSYKDIRIEMSINNTEQIEAALLNGDADLGIVEGQSKNPLFQYTEFVEDRIVPVTARSNGLGLGETMTTDDLLSVPILLREPGSGTLEVIAHALKAHGLKLSDLNCEMQLGSTVSLKSYLMHSDCIALLSIHSIQRELKNNELRIITIENLTIDRRFHFIRKYGDTNSISQLFIDYAKSYNFK